MADPLPYYTGEIRYLDKGVNVNERQQYDNWMAEQISMYGQSVDYYVYNYQLSAHDPVYGEQPAASFSSPIKIVMMLELSEASLIFGKFGIQSEDDITAYVSISSFYTSMRNDNVSKPEPKAGDVFKLAEYGDDRPGGRDGKMFEITERLDEDNSSMNPLMGHYVWQIKAKRADYTFEPGLSAEKKSDQVTDGDFAGRITSPQSDAKVDSTHDVDVEAQNTFNYDDIDGVDDVYGDYY